MIFLIAFTHFHYVFHLKIPKLRPFNLNTFSIQLCSKILNFLFQKTRGQNQKNPVNPSNRKQPFTSINLSYNFFKLNNA